MCVKVRAEEAGLRYLELSALTGVGIEQSLNAILEDVAALKHEVYSLAHEKDGVTVKSKKVTPGTLITSLSRYDVSLQSESCFSFCVLSSNYFERPVRAPLCVPSYF